jgi:hypothetical protein
MLTTDTVLAQTPSGGFWGAVQQSSVSRVTPRGSFRWGSEPRLNFCPYCGVSRHEPGTRQAPTNPTA